MNKQSIPFEKFYETLVKLFLDKVELSDAIGPTDCYWKWHGTSQVADAMDLPCSVVRKVLKHLEERGRVHSLRDPNYIRWAANDIPGFAQHKFKDYYYRTNQPPNNE